MNELQLRYNKIVNQCKFINEIYHDYKNNICKEINISEELKFFVSRNIENSVSTVILLGIKLNLFRLIFPNDVLIQFRNAVPYDLIELAWREYHAL